MEKLLEVMAKSLVDNPDEVVITKEEKEDMIVLNLKVAESDMGKVIGKSGRIAKGCGLDISEVNRLTKQFAEMQKMMKQMTGMSKHGGIKNFGRMFKGMGMPF